MNNETQHKIEYKPRCTDEVLDARRTALRLNTTEKVFACLVILITISIIGAAFGYILAGVVR